MKNKKTDQRSKFTQTIIQNSLLKLLSQKPLKEITVAELCRQSEVNRGTFYNHFYDIYDVYETIEGDFLKQIEEKLNSVKVYHLEYSFFKEIMFLISKNQELTAMIAANRKESALLSNLIPYAKNKYVLEYQERYPNLKTDFIECIFTYILNGTIGLIAEWLQKGGLSTFEQMAELIDQFNSAIIQEFFEKEKK